MVQKNESNIGWFNGMAWGSTLTLELVKESVADLSLFEFRNPFDAVGI